MEVEYQSTLLIKIQELESRILLLESKRNENYYQKFLERQFSATHKKTTFGITDITTKNEHIEIKHWRDYKSALGQLLSYNFNDNKKLMVYFFGTTSAAQKENIKMLFSSNNIETWDFVDNPNGIQTVCLCPSKVESSHSIEKDTFEKWLDCHISPKDDSIISLKDICEMYLGKKVGPRTLSIFKTKIEIYIKINFKHINYHYKNTTFNNIKYRGWRGLSI